MSGPIEHSLLQWVSHLLSWGEWVDHLLQLMDKTEFDAKFVWQCSISWLTSSCSFEFIHITLNDDVNGCHNEQLTLIDILTKNRYRFLRWKTPNKAILCFCLYLRLFFWSLFRIELNTRKINIFISIIGTHKK